MIKTRSIICSIERHIKYFMIHFEKRVLWVKLVAAKFEVRLMPNSL